MLYVRVVWLGGRVDRALDLRLTGFGFKPWPMRCRLQLWACCSYSRVSVTKQYNWYQPIGGDARRPGR